MICKCWATIGVATVSLLGTRAEALIQFDQETIVRSGQDYEAKWITADYHGSYIMGAVTVGETPVVKGVIRGWNGNGSYGVTRGSVFSEFGSIASGRGPFSWLLQTRYMTQYDPVSGLAAMTPFGSSGSIPPTTISSPAGKLIALSNAISVDANGRSYSLFEVQPPSGARKVLFLTYLPGVINYKKTFSLAEGDVVLDVAPRSDGGIVFLSGSSSAAAYMNYIDPAGTRHGPYFVGAASEIAYSPSAGGTVFTAGVGPSGNMHFTRGSLTAPPFDSSFVPFPFASSDFTFTCSTVMENDTCWWGGSYTKPSSDRNGFITATRNNGNFDNFGTQIAGGEPFDEAVRSIATTENGLSMWAGDGQCAVFDSGTGVAYATHPSVPDPNIQFRSVAVSSGNRPYPFVFPNTNFGVVGFNSATQKSVLVRVAMGGELRTAQASLDSYVGGTNPTIYVQLFQSVSNPLSFEVQSSSGQVAAPANVNFPGDQHIASFSVFTEPVAVAQDIDITIGNARSVVAHFRLLPPVPYLFSPANQTIKGGNSTVSRLSLNGKAPAGGLPVAMSSNGVEVIVAPTLLVPAGLYSRSFAIQTLPVVSTVTRTVTATYAGVSKSTAISLTP